MGYFFISFHRSIGSVPLSHRNQSLIIGPMRLVEQRTGFTVGTIPIHIFESGKRRRSELERTAIQHHYVTLPVNAPQATAVITHLVPSQKVAMMVDIAELQFSVTCNYKFLIHNLSLLTTVPCIGSLTSAKVAFFRHQPAVPPHFCKPRTGKNPIKNDSPFFKFFLDDYTKYLYYF